MIIVRYFDITLNSTPTTITIAPAAEIVMILGDMEMVLAVFVDYTQAETLRLCHVIDMAA